MKPTSAKQKANQKNASKSTGPRTEEGKGTVALNGIAHGLRSLKPVIPWLETEEDWLAHRDQVVSHFKPENALEAALADRIALGFWRLARSVETQPRIIHAAREKRRWIAISNSLLAEGMKPHHESAEATLESLSAKRDQLADVAETWEGILENDEAPLVHPNHADIVLDSVCPPESFSALGDAFNESFDWPPETISDLRNMVDWLIENRDESEPSSIEDFAEMAKAKSHSLSELVDRVERAGEQAADLALIESDVLEKLQRYETSIHRTLQRDLHEMQRLQGMRNGDNVMAPISIDLVSDV